MSEEVKTTPAKRPGRPAKKVAPTVQTVDEVVEETSAPAVVEVSKATDKSEGVPDGRIIAFDEEANVEVELVNGMRIATETVYRKRLLPFSTRHTYYLVASKGSKV